MSGNKQGKVRTGKMACMPQTQPVSIIDSKPCN